MSVHLIPWQASQRLNMARYATGTATEIRPQRDSNPVPTSTLHYYYYYFPTTITFIITFEPKKHNTCRLQSNIQIPLLLPLYHTLPQTPYYR